MPEDTNTTPINEAESAATQPDQTAAAGSQPVNPYANAQHIYSSPQQQPTKQEPPANPYDRPDLNSMDQREYAQDSSAAAQPAPQPAPQPTQAAPQQPAQADAQQQYYAQPQYAQPQQYAQPAYSQQYAQQPPAQPGMPQDPQANLDGKATGALVCGILSIVFCWTVFISLVLGIVAVVLGAQVIKAMGANSKAKGGKICGIIGIVFSVLIVLFTVLLVVGIVEADHNGSLSSIEKQYGISTSSVTAQYDPQLDIALPEIL